MKIQMRCSQAGVTLIELLVVLIVVGIIASIAVPGFGSLLATNSLNTAQEDVIGVLKKARAIAVARSTFATVTFTAATKTVVLSLSDNSRQPETLTLKEAVGINADAIYIFNPDGTATMGTIVLNIPNYPSIVARNMTVTATGQVTASR